MIARQFRSPLLGTALVLMALAGLVVPLHRLTARSGEVIHEAATDPASHSETTRTVLRIRVLDTLEDVEIRASDDRILYQAKILEPGEVEADAEILLENNKTELHVNAKAGGKETALFITLLPDGHEERTTYVIGSGALDETLLFDWEHRQE